MTNLRQYYSNSHKITKREDISNPFEVLERQTLEVEIDEKNKYLTILFFSQLYTHLHTCQKSHPLMRGRTTAAVSILFVCYPRSHRLPPLAIPLSNGKRQMIELSPLHWPSCERRVDFNFAHFFNRFTWIKIFWVILYHVTFERPWKRLRDGTCSDEHVYGTGKREVCTMTLIRK